MFALTTSGPLTRPEDGFIRPRQAVPQPHEGVGDLLQSPESFGTPPAMSRRPDRAQTLRTRRQWWTRHGAFVRGLVTGVVLTVIAALAGRGLWLR
jgi:hypothetical protein